MDEASQREYLSRALHDVWHWPSPEAGFSKLVLTSIAGPPVAVGALTLAEADRQRLDRAPLLAAGGYSYYLGEAPSEMDRAWAAGFARIAERDAIPLDRRSFLFEPLELLGISLGALRCSAVDSALLRWLRQVVQQLEPLLQSRQVWNYLLSYWAAHLLGVSWHAQPLPPVSVWASEELALAAWLSRRQPEIAAAHQLGEAIPLPLSTPGLVANIRDPARAALFLFTASQQEEPSLGVESMPPDLSIIRIGIVTALPEEFAAVRAMLDEPFDLPTRKHDDPHPYVLGWVCAPDGRHLVATTLAPKMGNNSAASMAAHLIRTLPSIHDVLMVGIAGGIPNPENPESHVRVGDVVISNEYGVVQYDNIKLGKGPPKVRDTSSPPAAWLVAKIKQLEARRLAGERPWELWIERGQLLEGGRRPPDNMDILVDRKGNLILHPIDPWRVPGQPRIHYGRIASANILLKRSLVRDALRRDHQARAVEMEGSGIADSTWETGRGYLLIRGICDYCDQKKNDAWHVYAAVAAASYAVALLSTVGVAELRA